MTRPEAERLLDEALDALASLLATPSHHAYARADRDVVERALRELADAAAAKGEGEGT